MDIGQHYREVREEIDRIVRHAGRNPEDITLVAVSKGHPVSSMHAAAEAGTTDFGENKVQEALAKLEEPLPPCHLHFIGTLQRNKVNKVINRFTLIHSIESLPLAERISSLSEVPTPILLQVNCSGEERKHGFTPESLLATFPQLINLSGIHIQGLMTMAPLTEDDYPVWQSFRLLRKLRDELATPALPLPELSMGMSGDYPLAIQEGATLVRIGTAIFGPRHHL